MPEIRILNRVIRLSENKPEAPLPEPLLKYERHGHVNTNDPRVHERMNQTVKTEYGEFGPHPQAQQVGHWAVLSGKRQIEPSGNGHLVADENGNVTAHNVNEHEHILRTHGFKARDKALNDAHDDMVKQGKLFGKVHVGHRELPAFLRAMDKAYRDVEHPEKRDAAPSLVFSDWAREHGHDDLADLIRLKNHIHEQHGPMDAWDFPGITPEVAANMVADPKKARDALKQYEELAKERGIQFSHEALRLAGPLGAAPVRRHAYTPKPRASDASEAEWSKIKHYFPAPEMGPRNRKTPVRVLMNATLFRLENGLSLREMEQVAPDFPPWGSVHSFENMVSEAGLWPTIISEMGRTQLLEKLPHMIHGASQQTQDRSAKVDVGGVAEPQ